MANTLNLGNGNWATKEDSLLGYNSESGNFKPLPFDFTRASNATVVNKDGLIETVGSGEPRIDFKDNTKGALLLEPSRSNLISYSEDFSNSSWVKLGQGIGSAPIVTPNYAISPDGTLNASRLQCDLNGGNTTNDRSWLYQSISTITGDNTFSLYVKNNSNEDITFSLTNGSSETVVVLSDDKWHRLSTVRSGGGQPRIGLIGGIGASNNADLLIYGAQIEQGSYATSYIPTSGSAVTRVADACNNGGNEQVINSIEGVLYAEISALANDGTERVISLQGASSSDRVSIQYNTTTNQIKGFVRVGGTFVASLEYTVTDITDFHKVALKYKLNDFQLWIDGILREGDASGVTFAANTLIKTSLDIGGVAPFYGKTKDLRLYNTALTDAELQALTKI